MEMFSFASLTRSLLLPVLYSSTHNANRLGRQFHIAIEGSDFVNLSIGYRLLRSRSRLGCGRRAGPFLIKAKDVSSGIAKPRGDLG